MTSFRGLLYLAVLFFFASDLVAGSLEVMVKDEKGGPVSDAVVYASGGATGSPSKKRTVIDQRDKQFVPYVTALQVGTAVLFPNSDNIRHHVYSFSPAKKFELPLYSGVPAEPITSTHFRRRKNSSCLFTAAFRQNQWFSTRWALSPSAVTFTIG